MRHLLVVTLSAAFAVSACSSGGSPGTSGKAGSGGTTTGTAGQTGTAGAGTGTAGTTTGTAGAGGGATGTAGAGTAGMTTGGGGGGSTGTAGASGGATGTAGTTASNPDASTTPDGNAGEFPTAACAPGAIFCDDFEEYNLPGAKVNPTGFVGNTLQDFIAVGSTTPTWLGYHLHGPPYIVTVAPKVFGGNQVYQLDTEDGHPVAADIIKESPDGVDLWPAAHYGRVMVNLKGLPATGTFGIVTESGLLPGSTTNMAQYTLGGVGGKVSFLYAQRVRPVKNDVSDPSHRVGGNWGPTTSPASQAPTTLCTVAATTQTIAVNKWVCVEWMVDRTKSELHLWLDGVAQTQVDVSGGGGTCSAGTAATWTGPAHFTELDLGWEINGSDAGGRGAQFDMFAIGTQKLGCPAP